MSMETLSSKNCTSLKTVGIDAEIIKGKSLRFNARLKFTTISTHISWSINYVMISFDKTVVN